MCEVEKSLINFIEILGQPLKIKKLYNIIEFRFRLD